MIIGVNYLTCGSNPEFCNVRWSGTHTPVDGSLPDVFSVDETHATCGSTINNDALGLPSIPMEGTWEFVPLENFAEKPPQGQANFLVEMSCR